MSHCIQKGHLRAYEEMRPQLHEGREEERPSRSLGRPSASDRLTAAANFNQRCSKVPTTCHSHQGRQDYPSSARLHVETKKAAAACILTSCIGKVLLASPYPKTCQLPRAARQKLCICMPGRGSNPTDWLGVQTWDHDLPPLIRTSRRRCWGALRRFRTATRRTRPPHSPNFCEGLLMG